jgi:hypothetical protein
MTAPVPALKLKPVSASAGLECRKEGSQPLLFVTSAGAGAAREVIEPAPSCSLVLLLYM